MEQRPDPDQQWLLYDGECPFCAAYVSMVRLRDAVGPMPLINAREGGPELREARAAGLDLDEGMVLKFDGRLYHGQDCVNRLALITTPSGGFNRLYGYFGRPHGRASCIRCCAADEILRCVCWGALR
jgi:predicted DCC family thiol-disulfide oxidoreductase YuxK